MEGEREIDVKRHSVDSKVLNDKAMSPLQLAMIKRTPEVINWKTLSFLPHHARSFFLHFVSHSFFSISSSVLFFRQLTFSSRFIRLSEEKVKRFVIYSVRRKTVYEATTTTTTTIFALLRKFRSSILPILRIFDLNSSTYFAPFSFSRSLTCNSPFFSVPIFVESLFFSCWISQCTSINSTSLLLIETNDRWVTLGKTFGFIDLIRSRAFSISNVVPYHSIFLYNNKICLLSSCYNKQTFQNNLCNTFHRLFTCSNENIYVCTYCDAT